MRIAERVENLAKWISEQSRPMDDYVNGIRQGDNQPRLWAVSFILLCWVLLWGPCPRFIKPTVPGGYYTLLGSLVALIGCATYIHSRNPTDRWLCGLQFAVASVFLVIFVGLYLAGNSNITEPRFREGDAGAWLFPHIFQPIAFVVFLGALISWPSAGLRLQPMHEKFTEAEIDLLSGIHNVVPPRDGSAKELFWSSLSVPLSHPLILLLPTAILLLTFPNLLERLEEWKIGPVRVPIKDLILLSALGFTWMVLSVANWFVYFDAIQKGFAKLFLHRGLVVVSGLVILLAICWRARVSYVRTVIEGDSWAVCFYALSMFSLLWCHEYWLHRSWNLEVLDLIKNTKVKIEKTKVELDIPVIPSPRASGFEPFAMGSKSPAHETMTSSSSLEGASMLNRPPARNYIVDERPTFESPWESIEYGVVKTMNDPQRTSPPPHNHKWDTTEIRIYGASRLAIYRNGDRKNAYEPVELLTAIVGNLPEAKKATGQRLVSMIQLRERNHFLSVNLAVFVLLGGLMVFTLKRDRAPLVQCTNDPGTVDLGQLIFSPPAEPSDKSMPSMPRKVIFVAASGGGTRAALYTSAALEGLHAKGHLKDVVLGSGVSGGGVALAYFATHQEELISAELSDPNCRAAWNRFHDAMAHPYITDVLRGASEARILAQTTIGVLLSESLERQFYPGRTDTQPESPSLTTMNDVTRMGLILNTTVCGEWPPTFPNKNIDGWNSEFRAKSEYTSSEMAGSRLIFTNLNHQGGFPIQNPPDCESREYLRYVVVADPSVSVVKAAALNANFPPVFPNGPIEIVNKKGQPTRRFWLTDGGAEENKGDIALWYALRHEIKEMAKSTSPVPPEAWPEIHVIVLDAGASGVEYSHDQGLGAASGARVRLANGLAQELRLSTEAIYAKLTKSSDKLLQVHFLPMPSPLRFNGGLGTHWMMPDYVQFRETTVSAERENPVTVSRAAVQSLIRKLFVPAPASKQKSELNAEADLESQIQKWIERDPLFQSHFKRWRVLLKEGPQTE